MSCLGHYLTHPHTLQTLELGCLLGMGVVTGGVAYITFVEVPGRASKSPQYQLENYQGVFPLATNFFKATAPPLTMVAMATAILTEKKMWWIPSLLLGACGPFTALCVKPKDDILMAATDGDKVKDEIQAWNKLNDVRTYLSLVASVFSVMAVMGTV